MEAEAQSRQAARRSQSRRNNCRYPENIDLNPDWRVYWAPGRLGARRWAQEQQCRYRSKPARDWPPPGRKIDPELHWERCWLRSDPDCYGMPLLKALTQ